jgi:hypothetical protein
MANKSKRKANAAAAAAATAAGDGGQAGAAAAADGSNEPSTSGRPYTVTMAVSSSSIDNTQNIEFATFVAGQVRGKLRSASAQLHPCAASIEPTASTPSCLLPYARSVPTTPQIARTAAIFNIDELVIIDDTPQRKDGTVSAGAAFLARVAQYLETPQYLRKALIPMHPDLRLAGEEELGMRVPQPQQQPAPAV